MSKKRLSSFEIKICNFIKQWSNETYYASYADVTNYCDGTCTPEQYKNALDHYLEQH